MTPHGAAISLLPCRARAPLGAALLGAGWLLVGCTIQTYGSEPATPGATATPPAQTSPAGTARPVAEQEQVALRTSVAASVSTTRGLVEVVGEALRDPGLGAEARRAYDQATPKAQAARRALLSGEHRLAAAESDEAMRLLAPALTELSAKTGLPEPLLKRLENLADASRREVEQAKQAVRATGRTAGLGDYDRAAGSFINAGDAARAGEGGRSVRSIVNGREQLEHGIQARWPTLRAQ